MVDGERCEYGAHGNQTEVETMAPNRRHMTNYHESTYTFLDKLLGEKDMATIGNNTTAERQLDQFGHHIITVRLHGHRIIETTNHNGDDSSKLECITYLRTAGYRTVTTQDRLNRITPDSIRVVQRNFLWYVECPGGHVWYVECPGGHDGCDSFAQVAKVWEYSNGTANCTVLS